MSYRIWKSGNYVFIEDETTEALNDILACDLLVDKGTDSSQSYNFINRHTSSKYLYNIPITDIKDEDGDVYTASAFESWYKLNTGGSNREVTKRDIALGNVTGASLIDKWGYNDDLGTGTFKLVASYNGTFDPLVNIMQTAQTFTIAYDNTTDGDGQAGIRMLQIDYLDENFNLAVGYHTLGASGSDVTLFTGLGINRVVGIAFGSTSVAGANIDFTATSDGTTQARIPLGRSVTQQCIYHTPINSTAILDNVNISCIKVSGGGSQPDIEIRGYSFSRVTLGEYEVFDKQIDVQRENNLPVPMYKKFTGREVIYFKALATVTGAHLSLNFSGELQLT